MPTTSRLRGVFSPVLTPFNADLMPSVARFIRHCRWLLKQDVGLSIFGIAVCDGGGHALWLQRMDGAPVMSAQIAPEKARASALSGKPSKALEDMVNNGRVAALAVPIAPLEGGVPIVVHGVVIGAVGVSGVKAAEDAQVAAAGLKALVA